jgi:hypothetical protein
LSFCCEQSLRRLAAFHEYSRHSFIATRLIIVFPINLWTLSGSAQGAV